MIISVQEFQEKSAQWLSISQTEPVYISEFGKIISVLSGLNLNNPPQPSLLALFQSTPLETSATGDDFDEMLVRIRQQSAWRAVDFSE